MLDRQAELAKLKEEQLLEQQEQKKKQQQKQQDNDDDFDDFDNDDGDNKSDTEKDDYENDKKTSYDDDEAAEQAKEALNRHLELQQKQQKAKFFKQMSMKIGQNKNNNKNNDSNDDDSDSDSDSFFENYFYDDDTAVKNKTFEQEMEEEAKEEQERQLLELEYEKKIKQEFEAQELKKQKKIQNLQRNKQEQQEQATGQVGVDALFAMAALELPVSSFKPQNDHSNNNAQQVDNGMSVFDHLIIGGNAGISNNNDLNNVVKENEKVYQEAAAEMAETFTNSTIWEQKFGAADCKGEEPEGGTYLIFLKTKLI